MAGSSTESSPIPSPHGIMTDNKSDQQSLSDHLVASHGLSQDQVQGQWMPSNIRFVRKMMNSDHVTEKKQRRTSTQANQQDQTTRNSNNNSSHDIVRVCSACNTTKTPLWRTGPCGPKVIKTKDTFAKRQKIIYIGFSLIISLVELLNCIDFYFLFLLCWCSRSAMHVALDKGKQDVLLWQLQMVG